MKIRDFLIFTLLITSLFRCDYERSSGSQVPQGDAYDTSSKASLKLLTKPGIDIYVRTPQDGGSDSNPGTQDLPKATIQAAVDLIPLDGYGSVHVAAGTYAPCAATDNFKIDILGGYNAGDWNDRDISPNAAYIYTTRIESPADSGPAVTVTLVKNLTFEGFTVQSYNSNTPAMDVKISRIKLHRNYIESKGENGTGLNLDKSFGWIDDNLIYGSGGKVSGTTYALRANQSIFEITGNIINGGAHDNPAGILFEKSTGKIQDNWILGGEGKYTKAIQITGIFSTESDPLEISQNTIDGGLGTEETVGIMSLNGNIRVENNQAINARGGNTSFSCKNTRAIYSSQGAAIIKNNVISGGIYSGNSCGIYVEYSNGYNVEIENNTISGGTYSSYSKGISIINTFAVITHNKISGCNQSPGASIGVEIRYSPALLVNNSIWAGMTASSRTLGIINVNSDSKIINNTINTGKAIIGVFGIYNLMDSHPVISNNIIFSDFDSDPQVSFGIMNSSGSSPVVSYNDIWVPDDMGTDYTGVNNNISVNPFITASTGADYPLTVNSPVAVTRGAYPYTDITTIDILYNLRTAPWSMGAYEYDAL